MLNFENGLFFIVLFALVGCFAITERLIKLIIELFFSMMGVKFLTDDKKLKNGESTTQWNILSVIILSFLTFNVLTHHHIHNQCESIYGYQAHDSFVPLVIFSAYIVFDLLFHKMLPLTYFHHAIGLIPILIIFLTKYQPGSYYAVTALLTEISTIPLGLIYVVSDRWKPHFKILFALTFFLARPVFLSYVIMITYKCMLDDITYIVCIVFLTMLYCLNMYWFIGIYKKYADTKNKTISEPKNEVNKKFD